jgi:KRAB domain-containing zinc finger protein
MEKKLDKHQREVHSQQDAFTCKICDYVNKTSGGHNYHMRRHNTEREHHNDGPLPHKRAQPLSFFAHDVGGNAHGTADHTSIKPKARHICDVCGKGYATPGNLMRHVHQHHGKKGQPPQKNFKCDQCKMAFYFRYELNNHMICHTSDKPYQCEECGIDFAWKKNLDQHQKEVHTQEDAFICKICNYVNKTSGGHNFHMRRHITEREHECRTCNLRFASLSNLQQHQRIHQYDA